MKSFVAAGCARMQLEAEVGASSRVAELERMVSALQREKKDLEAPLASVRIRAETSIKQLNEAREQATAVEDAFNTAEEGRKKAEELVRAFRRAVDNEATPFNAKYTTFWSASASKPRRWLARTRTLLNSSSSSAGCDAVWP